MLWRKVRQGLSAGRVQSVATRMVVERERERIAFRAASYWDIERDPRDSRRATVPPARSTPASSQVDGRRVATGRDFGRDGQPVARFDGVHLDEADARGLAAALQGAPFDRALGRGQALHAAARPRRS